MITKSKRITYFHTNSVTTRIYECTEPIVAQGAAPVTHTEPYTLYPMVHNGLVNSDIRWVPLKRTFSPDLVQSRRKVNFAIPLSWDELSDREDVEPALVNELFFIEGVIGVTTGGTPQQPNRYRVRVKISAAHNFNQIHDHVIKALRKIVFAGKPTGLMCGDIPSVPDDVTTERQTSEGATPDTLDIERLRLIAKAKQAEQKGEDAIRRTREQVEEHDRQVGLVEAAVARMKNGGLENAASAGQDHYTVIMLNVACLGTPFPENLVRPEKDLVYETVMNACKPYGAVLGLERDSDKRDVRYWWAIQIPLAASAEAVAKY